MSKTVYQTDQYGIYTGSITADESPLEPGVWLIPGGCVEVEPPAPGEHQVPHWNGKRWQLVRSFQGLTAYNTATGEPLQIQQVGELPPGYTLSVPGPGQVWRDGDWVDDTPALLKRRHAERTLQVNAACEAAITGGFWSSALGAPHQYSSQLDDQLNLTGVILAGLDTLYACRDQAGAKEFRAHTAEQIRKVGDDFTVFKLQPLQRANALKQRLDQALASGDLVALEAVTWESAEL